MQQKLQKNIPDLFFETAYYAMNADGSRVNPPPLEVIEILKGHYGKKAVKTLEKLGCKIRVPEFIRLQTKDFPKQFFDKGIVLIEGFSGDLSKGGQNHIELFRFYHPLLDKEGSKRDYQINGKDLINLVVFKPSQPPKTENYSAKLGELFLEKL